MNLNQVIVPSLDLTKAIPFYVKLGLKLIVESFPDYARFECQMGIQPFQFIEQIASPKERE